MKVAFAYHNHIPEAQIEWQDNDTIIIRPAEWYGIDCYFDGDFFTIPSTKLQDYLKENDLQLWVVE